LISEVLNGSWQSINSFKDAQDNDIYEPPVGTTPLWEKVKLTALFSSEVRINLVAEDYLEICDINISDAFQP